MNWSAVFLAGPAHSSAAVAAGGVVAYSIAMVARAPRGRSARRALGRPRARAPRRRVDRGGHGARARDAFRRAGARRLRARRRGVRCARAGALPRRSAAPGVSSSAGIAAVATAGYTGGVVNGPAIGFLARGVGLTAALSLIAVAGALIALLGPRLQR